MSDLSNLSCSELQAEISRRRQAKEKEIKDKYVLMENQVKIKYCQLKEAVRIDKNIIEHIKQGSKMHSDDNDLERKLRYAYRFQHRRFSTDELFLVFVGVPGTLTPEDIINMAEQGALQSLKNAMYDGIAKLY